MLKVFTILWFICKLIIFQAIGKVFIFDLRCCLYLPCIFWGEKLQGLIIDLTLHKYCTVKTHKYLSNTKQSITEI